MNKINKISDLKVGDKVYTNQYGIGIVSEISYNSVRLEDLEDSEFDYFSSWEINWLKTSKLNNK